MGGILIVAELQNGRIREASYELASIAQKLPGDVHSLVAGRDIGGLGTNVATVGSGSAA